MTKIQRLLAELRKTKVSFVSLPDIGGAAGAFGIQGARIDCYRGWEGRYVCACRCTVRSRRGPVSGRGTPPQWASRYPVTDRSLPLERQPRRTELLDCPSCGRRPGPSLSDPDG